MILLAGSAGGAGVGLLAGRTGALAVTIFCKAAAALAARLVRLCLGARVDQFADRCVTVRCGLAQGILQRSGRHALRVRAGWVVLSARIRANFARSTRFARILASGVLVLQPRAGAV